MSNDEHIYKTIKWNTNIPKMKHHQNGSNDCANQGNGLRKCVSMRSGRTCIVLLIFNSISLFLSLHSSNSHSLQELSETENREKNKNKNRPMMECKYLFRQRNDVMYALVKNTLIKHRFNKPMSEWARDFEWFTHDGCAYSASSSSSHNHNLLLNHKFSSLQPYFLGFLVGCFFFLFLISSIISGYISTAAVLLYACLIFQI